MVGKKGESLKIMIYTKHCLIRGEGGEVTETRVETALRGEQMGTEGETRQDNQEPGRKASRESD